MSTFLVGSIPPLSRDDALDAVAHALLDADGALATPPAVERARLGVVRMLRPGSKLTTAKYYDLVVGLAMRLGLSISSVDAAQLLGEA